MNLKHLNKSEHGLTALITAEMSNIMGGTVYRLDPDEKLSPGFLYGVFDKRFNAHIFKNLAQAIQFDLSQGGDGIIMNRKPRL